VKEEGHMCVFLCLCDTGLLQAMSSQIFAKGIGDLLFYKCDLLVGDRHIILGKAYIGCFDPLSSFESGKIIITKSTGNFSCPVRTEIKENDRVLISDHSRRMSILFYNCRKYKLIGSVP